MEGRTIEGYIIKRIERLEGEVARLQAEVKRAEERESELEALREKILDEAEFREKDSEDKRVCLNLWSKFNPKAYDAMMQLLGIDEEDAEWR